MWDLNLGVQACQKKFKLFRHRNTYASIYSVYKKTQYNATFFKKKLLHNITAGLGNEPAVMYPHHCRFIMRTGSDELFPKLIK